MYPPIRDVFITYIILILITSKANTQQRQYTIYTYNTVYISHCASFKLKKNRWETNLFFQNPVILLSSFIGLLDYI